jgi:large subunit ribosomal protein L18
MQQARRKRERRKRAHQRLRGHLRGTGARPRLAVFKSLRFVYAQVIDDDSGRTLAQASSREASVQKGLEGGSKTKAAARKVGEVVAERALKAGIERVVFDRGGYIYHGKVREVAEGARAKGLEF